VTLIGSAQKRWMTLRQRDWLKRFRGKAMPKLQPALGLPCYSFDTAICRDNRRTGPKQATS
jgi:hypothetical protein